MEQGGNNASIPPEVEKCSKPPTSGCSCSGFGKRHVLALVSSCGFMIVYALRVNLSVALVAMVNNTAFAAKIKPNDSADEQCPNLELQNSSYSWAEEGEFNWGPTMQGIILGAFFYGYLTTQILGGYLADRFGGKWLFGVGILVTAILTIVSPFAARAGYSYLVAVRVLEGIGEGVTFPAMYALWSRWAPKLERSTLTAISSSGSAIGTIIAFPISGVLCEYGFDGGWPSVFYVFGSIGCLWFVIWCFLAYSSPEEHPSITLQERHYILSSIGRVGSSRNVPWKAMLTCRPVIALCVVQFCGGWGFYTILTSLPTYMKEILKLNMTSNGVTSALPYTMSFIFAILSGYIADLLQKKRILSTTLTRKLMTSIALFGTASSLMAVTLVGCNRPAVIALLTCSVGLYGASTGGFSINQLDLAPSYAGILMGLTNTVGTIPGILGPLVTGVLTNDKQSRSEWNLVFIISGGVFLFGLIVYLLFGSGKEQPWAVVKETLISSLESDSDGGDEGADLPGYHVQANNPSLHFDDPFQERVNATSVPQVYNSNVIL